jgi:hypothetical protein
MLLLAMARENTNKELDQEFAEPEILTDFIIERKCDLCDLLLPP